MLMMASSICMEGPAFSAPFPNLGSGSRNKTVHLMGREGERVAAYLKTKQIQRTGRQPLLLLFPGEGRIYVQTAAFLGGEPGRESNPGLAVGMSNSLFTGVFGPRMPHSSRTPWVSTGCSIET